VCRPRRRLARCTLVSTGLTMSVSGVGAGSRGTGAGSRLARETDVSRLSDCRLNSRLLGAEGRFPHLVVIEPLHGSGSNCGRLNPGYARWRGVEHWIVSRIDRVETKIDDLDKRVDALAIDMARMSGQLDLILQQGAVGVKRPGRTGSGHDKPRQWEVRSAAHPPPRREYGPRPPSSGTPRRASWVTAIGTRPRQHSKMSPWRGDAPSQPDASATTMTTPRTCGDEPGSGCRWITWFPVAPAHAGMNRSKSAEPRRRATRARQDERGQRTSRSTGASADG